MKTSKQGKITITVSAPLSSQSAIYCNPQLNISCNRCTKHIVLPMPMNLDQRRRLQPQGCIFPVTDLSDSRLDQKLRLCVRIATEMTEALVAEGLYKGFKVKDLQEMIHARYRSESAPIFEFMRPCNRQ